MATVSDDERALEHLTMHWGTAYDISVHDGEWLAQWHGTRDTLTAGTAFRLLELMRADHFRRTGPKPQPTDQGTL